MTFKTTLIKPNKPKNTQNNKKLLKEMIDLFQLTQSCKIQNPKLMPSNQKQKGSKSNKLSKHNRHLN